VNDLFEKKMTMRAKNLKQVLTAQIAAVSMGVVDGRVVTDLCYAEDSHAETDLNLVARSDGGIVEVQGTAEGAPLTRKELDLLVDQGLASIQVLCAAQREALAGIW
jgi:ribonuclease PH